MGVAYIRSTYGLEFVKRGLRVKYKGQPGTITSCTHRIKIRLDCLGKNKRIQVHPQDYDLEYIK